MASIIETSLVQFSARELAIRLRPSSDHALAIAASVAAIALFPHPPRSGGRHRIYDAEHVKRLRFILRSRELGFSIDEIRALLAIAGGHGGCADVYALTTQHLDVVKRKIADLRRLQRILSETAARCARDASPECPIIEALSTPHRQRPRQA